MLFHQGEQGPHYLAEHRPQRRRRIFGIMKLQPKIGLADLKSVGDGLRGHPNVNTETRDIRGPNVMREVGLDRLAAQCEVSAEDRKSTRLNSSHITISYAVFCLKK